MARENVLKMQAAIKIIVNYDDEQLKCKYYDDEQINK